MDFKDEVIEELIVKICCSAVQDLWHLMNVDDHIPDFVIRRYLENNDDYQALCEILNI